MFGTHVSAQDLRGAQSASALDQFLNNQEEVLEHNELAKPQKHFIKLINRLKLKRTKKDNEYDFLKTVFFYVQHKRLKFYDRHATMDDTLTEGSYGCVTGTALYAAILDLFEFKYTIVELPSHVFIQVHGKQGYYIFESTLPHSGFKKIDDSLLNCAQHLHSDYRTLLSQQIVGNQSQIKNLQNQPYKTINLTELAGLQDFNSAVRLYHSGEFKRSMYFAKKAYNLYPSFKNQELMQLIISKIIKHKLIAEDLKKKISKTK